MLYHVSRNDIAKAWGGVCDLLEPACERSDGDWKIDDVYHELMNDGLQLFVWQPKNKVIAACVTKIYSNRNHKICAMPLIGGIAMNDWLQVEDQLVKFAKEQGCDQLEGYCRDGWLRVLKNWRKVWTTMRRNI